MLGGLDALGNHLDAELVRHHDDGLAQGQLGGRGIEMAHEGLVDLDKVDVELLQVGQGRIAGTKVVQCHLNTGIAQRQQVVGHAGAVAQQQSFGDLDRQALPWQSQPFKLLDPGLVGQAVAMELHR